MVQRRSAVAAHCQMSKFTFGSSNIGSLLREDEDHSVPRAPGAGEAKSMRRNTKQVGKYTSVSMATTTEAEEAALEAVRFGHKSTRFHANIFALVLSGRARSQLRRERESDRDDAWSIGSWYETRRDGEIQRRESCKASERHPPGLKRHPLILTLFLHTPVSFHLLLGVFEQAEMQ